MRLGLLLCTSLLSSGCVMKARYDRDVLALNDQHADEVRRMEVAYDAEQSRARRAERELHESRTALDETSHRLTEKMTEAADLQDDMVRMSEALQELAQKQARAAQALDSYQDLVSKFQALIDAGTLEVKVIGGRMVVELATDILFTPGSATLNADGREAISEVALVLASIPEREYQVAGHTDNKPIHTERFPSNWHLGAARAIAVADVLTEAGLAPERLSAASFADFRPANTNRTPEGRAANRRIDIIVVPDLSTLPGYDDLQALSDRQDP